MNSCPCGWFQDAQKPCTCDHPLSQSIRSAFRDLYWTGLIFISKCREWIMTSCPATGWGSIRLLSGPWCRRRGRGSWTGLRARILFAPCENRDYRNADMWIAEVRKFCKLDETGDSLIRAAMSQLSLSARAYHRILKLARTIADLAGSEDIQTPHLAEALQYRPKGMHSTM
jgi:magnesium chelatase family protein